MVLIGLSHPNASCHIKSGRGKGNGTEYTGKYWDMLGVPRISSELFSRFGVPGQPGLV